MSDQLSKVVPPVHAATFVPSFSEAARCLGMAQATGDKAAADYWKGIVNAHEAVAKAALRIESATISKVVPPVHAVAGEVMAPSYRGYANLGIGGYLLLHSHEGEPAELCIVPARDDEKAGRVVGDLRHDGPDEIPAERMAVRLRFANVAGLDALEQQLRLLREVHFPAAPSAATGEGVDRG